MELTRREIEVLRLKAEGNTAAASAVLLFVEKRTIEFHLQSIYRKFGVDNGIRAIAVARERGILK